jgi:hypothetical protein
MKSEKKRRKKPVQNNNVNIAQNSSSFKDLFSGLTETGIYSHMRLILTKNNDRRLRQKYLMVSRNAFGLVRLCDVDFDDNQICIALQDINTGIIKNVYLDINDSSFRFLLISWQDIREIIKGESINKPIEDDLLDFEF